MNESQLIQSLRAYFRDGKIESYFVGGFVRDALLGRSITDVDIAIKGDAEFVTRKLASHLNGHYVPLDVDRGITRVVVTYEGRSRYIDISSFQSELVDDLKRRDFTINAMALPIEDSIHECQPDNVIDPFDGLSDLKSHTIRTVIDSVFREDPVRLLRAPRLAVQLDFEIEDAAVRRIRKEANLVNTVASERVRDEFLKILAETHSTRSLRLLNDLGLLCEVIPEIAEAKNVTQPKEHYWDVFNHLIETPSQLERIFEGQPVDGDFVTNYVPTFKLMNERFSEEVSDGHARSTIVKLAAVLHDIAKPATRTVESSGRIRFLGHHTEGAEIAERILRRLRVSGRGVELVRLMVQHHLRPSQMAQKGELPSGRAIYRYYRDVGEAAIDTLYLNMADYLAARGPMLEANEWKEHCGIIGHILKEGFEEKAPETLPKLVSGYDIMKAFAMNPGPVVGELLNLVHEAQANGEIVTREEAIELVRANLNSGVSGA